MKTLRCFNKVFSAVRLLVATLVVILAACGWSSVSMAVEARTLEDESVRTLGADRGTSSMAKRALYLELGGNGLFYTLNYDHMLSNKVSVRVGAGLVTSGGLYVGTAPITLNYLLGEGDSRLELGAGALIATSNYFEAENTAGVAATATFAYRYQKPNGIFLKAAFTPVFRHDFFLPWFGFSIGYALN